MLQQKCISSAELGPELQKFTINITNMKTSYMYPMYVLAKFKYTVTLYTVQQNHTHLINTVNIFLPCPQPLQKYDFISHYQIITKKIKTALQPVQCVQTILR